MLAKTDLDGIFNPESIAIAGVSTGTEIWSIGQRYLKLLLDFGFTDRIYPVNPKGGEILGVNIYANVKDIPDTVDYVICCIPAERVSQLIMDCEGKGVKAMQFFTSGFSETGTEEGRKREEEICHLAEQMGIRLIGPNCAGIYNPSGNLTNAEGFPEESGSVALMCQSGGNSFHFVRAAAQRGVRFSKVISYGNACDINECDLLEYFAADPETKIIAVYIEGFKDGRRFNSILREAVKTKPVVILKGGLTGAGARAAAGHTGALATSADIWEGFCQQNGVVAVNSIEEMVDAVVTFLYFRLPGGRKVASIGIGGGSTVLATDDCVGAGLELPRLPIEVQENIRSHMLDDAGTILTNPLDLSVPAIHQDIYDEVFYILDNYNGIDLQIAHVPYGVMHMPSSFPEKRMLSSFVPKAIKAHNELTKPVATVIHSQITIEDWTETYKYQEILSDAGVPFYYTVKNAALAISRFMRYHGK